MTLKFDGEREDLEITAGPRDQLAWEEAAGDRGVSQLINDPKLKDYYTLAHITAKRQELFDGTYKEFKASVDVELGHTLSKSEDEPETDDEDEDPTQPGPSDDH